MKKNKATYHYELTISFPYDPQKEWDKEIAEDIMGKTEAYAKSKWREAGRKGMTTFAEEGLQEG